MRKIEIFSPKALKEICNQTLYKLPIYKYWYKERIFVSPLLSTIRIIAG
jgi:hypothetical protein